MGPFNSYRVLATLAFLALVTGVFFRRRKKIHATFMLSGISLDVVIVLLLEFKRDVVGLAIGYSYYSLSGGHIIASLIACILYIPTLIFGVKRLRGHGDAKTRAWHIRSGIAAFSFRMIGFILMFSLPLE